jgi:hypothetical protein
MPFEETLYKRELGQCGTKTEQGLEKNGYGK